VNPLDFADYWRPLAVGVTLGAIVAAVVPPPANPDVSGPPSQPRSLFASQVGQSLPLAPDVGLLDRSDPPVAQSLSAATGATLQLFGVIVSRDRGSALLGAAGQTPAWVKQGESFRGMVLSEITSNSAELTTSAGGSIKLTVFAPTKPPADN